MSFPTRDSSLEPFYSSYEADDDFGDRFELSPGERIGDLTRSKSDAIAWGVSLVIIVSTSFILTRDPANWTTALAHATSSMSAALGQSQGKDAGSPQNLASTPPPSAPSPVAQPALATAAPPSAASMPNAVTMPASRTAAKPDPATTPADKPVADGDSETAALPSPKQDDDTEASDMPSPKSEHHDRDDVMSDYSPASLDVPKPHDRYAARAEAAGLHPGLSHAVLARFSQTDFRNARTAIDSAIAKTPNNGTFIWPRRRQPRRALFKVHFVAGAPPDCRRYVVTVTMDGWTTTALPMEKCGASRVATRK